MKMRAELPRFQWFANLRIPTSSSPPISFIRLAAAHCRSGTGARQPALTIRCLSRPGSLFAHLSSYRAPLALRACAYVCVVCVLSARLPPYGTCVQSRDQANQETGGWAEREGKEKGINTNRPTCFQTVRCLGHTTTTNHINPHQQQQHEHIHTTGYLVHLLVWHGLPRLLGPYMSPRYTWGFSSFYSGCARSPR